MKDNQFRIILSYRTSAPTIIKGTVNRIITLLCPLCNQVWFHHPDLRQGFEEVTCAGCGQTSRIAEMFRLALELSTVKS